MDTEQEHIITHMQAAYHNSKTAEVPYHVRVLQQMIGHLTFFVHGKRLRVLDLGCGTGTTAPLFTNHVYTGADLPYIINNCARINFPDHKFIECDFLHDDLTFIEDYDVVLLNGVIDVMAKPLNVLNRILPHCKNHVLMHRQEVAKTGPTTSIAGPGYAEGSTPHSIINEVDLIRLLDDNCFFEQEKDATGFTNWEGGGASFWLMREASWALHNLDHKLYQKYFKGRRHGFFIEAGANDGELQSNTMYFEQTFNWQGILIEPVRDVFVKLEASDRNQSKNIVVHAALVADAFIGDSIELCYTEGCHGLMSVVSGQSYTGPHLKLAMEEAATKVKCHARTLNSILDNHKNKIPAVIDLLVLDVEGYELPALQGIDFDKWNVRVLMIEQRDYDNKDIETYLAPWYTCDGRISHNDVIYLRK